MTKDITFYDKSLNAKCVCGSGLIWKKYSQIMLEPCEHIIHCKCLNSQRDKTKCPICKDNITSFHTFKDLQQKKGSTKEYYQKYTDMVSMRNFDDLYDNGRNYFNMIDVLGIVSRFPFLSGHDDGADGCRDLLSLMNSKIIVKGLDNINRKEPRVFIANHTSYLDFPVIFYLLRCGFLASSVIKDMWVGKQIMNIVPLLIIERGKNGKNTVEKMREYVKETGSICLFPEGMISNPDTLLRFRTGAFFVGFPIYPVVIRYDPIIYDTNMNNFVSKLSGVKNFTVYVDILEAERPPFSPERIEEIRHKMAKAGNFALSRVSNRDIKD